MSEKQEIELKPVNHITTDAIGPPGKRIFYIQGWKENQVITLVIEKFQLQTLAIGIEQFLAEIQQRSPMLSPSTPAFEEEIMRILPPVEPLFRVAEFSLAYEDNDDLVALIAREYPDSAEEDLGFTVRYWCTRSQIRAFINWGLEVSKRGRPQCPQCSQPMDPEGHFCARKNGHKY